MHRGRVLETQLWQGWTKEATAFLLCTLVVVVVFAKMLCTCLENPFFLPELNFFCNQSTTLNSLFSFISKQFV